MNNALLRDALAMLKQAGIRPQIRQGRHFKVCWTDRAGHARCLIVARSPSDWRAGHNNRRELRRLLRAMS
jgi:hypothetical protein